MKNNKKILHEVIFSESAVFDYEHCLVEREPIVVENDTDWNLPDPNDEPVIPFPETLMREELEEYIQNHAYTPSRNYFRCRWYDDSLDKELMLFIKRAHLKGRKQFWRVVGIIYAEDWCEEKEEDGVYRYWYETDISLKDVHYDWVEEEQIKNRLAEIEKELEEVGILEWEHGRLAEHDRRFSQEDAKASQAELDKVRGRREKLESARRTLKSELKRFKSVPRSLR